jgi:hypothetical protein
MKKSLEMAITGQSTKQSPNSTDMDSHVDHVEREGRPHEAVLEKPEVISTVHAMHKNIEHSSISEILDLPQSKEQMLFRVQMQAVAVQPNNLMELCQLYCKTCNETRSFKTHTNVSKCPTC